MSGNPKKIRLILFIILFIFGISIAISAGEYRQHLRKSESVHFNIVFPADNKPAGGYGARGKEGVIYIYYNKQGFLKRLIQPDTVDLSTHWLRNIGKRPYFIQLELVNITPGISVEWRTFEKYFDYNTKSFTKPIYPGQRVNMDWIIHISDELRDKPVIYDGGIRVIDRKTGEVLSFLPVKIVNTEV